MLLRRFTKLVTFTLFLWLLGFCVFLYSIPNNPSNNYLSTDAFIIFTGGTNRVSKGIEEFNKSEADKILISGVGINISKKDIVSRLPYIYKKLESDEKMVLGRIANNTLSNAAETAMIVQLNKIKSITIVTSNYHMPRSRFVLSSRIPYTQIEYLPIKTREKDQIFEKLGLLISEYHKSIASILIVLIDNIDRQYREHLKLLADQISGKTHSIPVRSDHLTL